MITPKEVKDELQHYVGEFGMDYYGEKHFPVTTKYLSQQEKKDKLLELYREHKKLVPFKTGLGKDSKRVIDISIEIKALEEELK